MSKGDTKQVHLYLDADLYEQLKEEAKQIGLKNRVAPYMTMILTQHANKSKSN